jgi:predicted DCC family thiol-disulfide oxidoreductase YuxK
MSETSLLLFDGDCAMCSRAVRFVLAADRAGRIRVAPLQGPTAAAYAAQHPAIGAVSSLVFLSHGRAAVKSDGVLAVLDALGGGWRWLAAVARLIPQGWRDAAYDEVARRRQRVSAALGPCPVPPLAVRHRVLP